MPSNYDELPLEGISPFARVDNYDCLLSYAMVGKMIYDTYKIMGGVLASSSYSRRRCQPWNSASLLSLSFMKSTKLVESIILLQ